MKRRWLGVACVAFLGWLGLMEAEHWAQAQTTGGSGGGSGGSITGSGNSIVGGGNSITGGNGGSSNQNFSGGQGGFTGTTNQTSSGGTRGGGSASGGTPGIPATSNVFGKNYVNPQSMGLTGTSGTTGKGTFNQPLYAVPTTSGRGGSGTGGAKTTQATVGFNTYGMNREIPYYTNPGDDMPLLVRAPAALHADVKDVIDRSTNLSNKSGISVSVDGARVILRGQVTSPRERKLVEGMVRLTPGVRDVANELTIGGKQ